MTREEVLIWLTRLGKDWVGLHEVYEAFDTASFWLDVDRWHDAAHITKRHNTANYERYQELGYNEDDSIEQYRLTKRALNLLTSA